MSENKSGPKTGTPMSMTPSQLMFAYDEVIKQPGLYILRKIRDQYADKFSEVINLELLNEISDKDLPYIYAARNEINPLKWLATREFDYELNYSNLCQRFKTMYIETESTSMFEHMDYFLKGFFITSVYFWSRDYDKRIDFDIQSSFNGTPYTDKVKYIVGPLDKVIEKVHPDMLFYPYINEDMLNLTRAHKDIIFAYPNYGFNMGQYGMLKGQTDSDDNVGVYPIIQNHKPHYLG